MNENKKILKNSLILYGRLFITTIIGLYTSRIVLQELGTDDFGLYTVVGGIVTMMNFLNTTMISTTNRYIAIEIGKKGNGNINKVFNTSLIIHLILAIFIVVVVETVGVWYVKNYLVVSTDRLTDALFVLHFSMLATVFSIVSIPFQGLITANENFLVRVTIEIIRTFLRLIFVLLLIIYLGNKLRAYAVFMTIVMIIPPILFYLYCRIKNSETIKWKFNNQIIDYLDMLKYSGWVMLGVFASIGRRQGAAIVINIFFGTLLNAAFGIATQVQNYIQMFVRNLNQAAIPQIMKSHSSGDSKRSLNLVYYISKYSYFLMLLISLPILLSLKSILKLWLVNVPEFTYEFTNLMIINGLISSVSTGFDGSIHATGIIKASHIYYSLIIISTIPMAYILYSYDFPPYTISILAIVASIINLIVQMKILTKITEFRIAYYLQNTIYRVMLVSIVIFPLIFLRHFFEYNLLGIFLFSSVSAFLTLLSIFFLGITRKEKDIFIEIFMN